MAEHCARAPWLSTKYRESRPVTRFGSAVDVQVSTLLSGNQLPEGKEVLLETEKIIDWAQNNYPSTEWEWYPQHPIVVADPLTGEVLTKGTPDLICLHRTLPKIHVVDWKKKGQFWAGHLPPPDENPQQLSYLAGAWLEFAATRKIDEGQIVLACWDAKGVLPLYSSVIDEDRLWDIVARVKAVPKVDPEGEQPEATVGDHCDDCYQRMHCDAHLLPATVVATVGLPAPGFADIAKEPITADNVAAALAWAEKADELTKTAAQTVKAVRANIDAYVRQFGSVQVGAMEYGPVPTKGKRMGATVETLEKEGLQRLIRPAKAGVKCDWFAPTGGVPRLVYSKGD